jgi:hypothetical protein
VADFDETVTGLRNWSASHDAHVRAAVELLAWHGFWLRRADFVKAATGHVGTATYIRWAKAREFADSSPRCSTSEMTVLRLAIAIGNDDLGLTRLGHSHRAEVVKAFADALGVEEISRG